MADVDHQRRDNVRLYWIHVVVGERRVWARWSYLGVPNFILVAFRSDMKRCRGWVDHLPLDQRRKVLAERDTKLVVCAFSGVRSEERVGSRGFDHVVDYSPIEEQPSLVTMGDWAKWLRENDTQGDILSPRSDAAGQ